MAGLWPERLRVRENSYGCLGALQNKPLWFFLAKRNMKVNMIMHAEIYAKEALLHLSSRWRDLDLCVMACADNDGGYIVQYGNYSESLPKVGSIKELESVIAAFAANCNRSPFKKFEMPLAPWSKDIAIYSQAATDRA